MAYKKRKVYSRKLQEARSKQVYPVEVPNLRRQIIVRDLDFGEVEHKIDLYRTRRIDTYDMVVDGKLYIKNIGWSTVLEILRKQFIRVGANG